MNKFKIHIVIVSDQVLPNVLPAMDYNFKPDRVVLCESDVMQRMGVGRALASFFKSKNIKVEFFRLGSAHDFKELHKKFSELSSKFGSRSADVAVNLVGGTKLISIIAQNVFATNKFTCFYAEPQKNSLVVMKDGKIQYHQLQDKIKLSDYFKIYGYTVISKREKNLKLVSGSHALCRELLTDFVKYGNHVSYLNELAAGAECYFSLKAKAYIAKEEALIFDLFKRHGFISSFNDTMVQFASDEDRSFCKGVWLEDYLHQTLKSINKDAGLQDFATSLVIENSSGTRFEIDAAFLYKNKLYVVEAKTSSVHDWENGVLSKLNNLNNFAGVLTFSIVVALQELRHFDKNVAKSQGVYLVQSTEVNELESKIRSILGLSSAQALLASQ
ncbi:MAG: DUF1887 family CARF protein [Kiritimatiellae bacterium]|nr:DUF1887 family CARF protein [Kiritimatiellia bacterium]